MSKKTVLAGVGLFALLLLYATASSRAIGAQDDVRAFVVNLASPHPISGRVSVAGTIQHSAMLRFEDVVVTTARRDEIPAWVEAGTADTESFTSLVLSLQGQMRGTVTKDGTMGVVLVPDEEPILQALSEGVVQLSLETTAPVAAGYVHFSGSEPWLPIAFPRYRVYFYNTTGQGASANLFIYLKN